jgi:molybdenum cofactor cytidylyltransferase
LLVVGHDRERVRAAAGATAIAHIVNDRYAKGLSTSIVSAVEALEHCADAVLIVLADQVAITEDHLQALLDNFDGQTAVATEYAGSVGPPAIFSRAQFAALRDLRGDGGAKQLMMSTAFPVQTIHFEPAAVDIDTRDDLSRVS